MSESSAPVQFTPVGRVRLLTIRFYPSWVGVRPPGEPTDQDGVYDAFGQRQPPSNRAACNRELREFGALT